MPVFQGMVRWQPPARGANRMSDLSAYRDELEKLLQATPNEAIQVALEPADRVATIKNRFRRALKEASQDHVALRFRSIYNAEQERRRQAGDKKVEPEKLLVTYTLRSEPKTRRPRRRSGSQPQA